MKETWKPVAGYEGYYEVSSRGRIRSISARRKRKISSRILKSGLRSDGYHNVVLCKDGVARTRTVHRIVAEAFFGPSDLSVNHKDGNRGNNGAENLEWLSIRGNIHAGNLCKKGSQFPGVAWDVRARKWISRIQVRGRRIYLGLFNSEQDASAAFNDALSKIECGEKVKSAAHKPSSEYRGVHWDKERSKWVASISIQGRVRQLGRFGTEEEAAAEYRRESEKSHLKTSDRSHR